MLYPLREASGEVRASYLYNLANFTGPVPSSWPKISVDREQNEIYVINTSDLTVRIFNEYGMEVYSFGIGENTGVIYGAAPEKDGNIVLLSFSGSTNSITRCNYRGEPISKIELKNLPLEIAQGFTPDAVVYSEGRLYFTDKDSMLVVVTDSNGSFERSYDLFAILKLEEQKRGEIEISGFSVDREGNMLFTIPVLFQAYKLSPDGNVKSFGERGSSPGKFNVIAGIASDDHGNYYVADILKCVIIVFDKDFKFLTQFGYRGSDPGNLIAPRDLAIHQDKLYVTQSRDRGVCVFKLSYG